MNETVGIIGLGIMGGAYARHLLAKGHAVIGYDPSPQAQDALRAAGGEVAADAKAVAEKAGIVLLALASPKVLEATVAALQPALTASHVIAEMGTLPVEAKTRAAEAVAAKGALMLDCPVSGTGAQADTGDIIVYASGDPAGYARLEPVFRAFSREVRLVGVFGDGMKLKLIANLLVTIHNLAAAEALLLAQKSGLDLQMVYETVKAGAGQSKMFDLRVPLMIDGRYEPATMKMDVYQKDIALILDHARELGVPVPLMSASVPYYAAAIAQGRQPEDTAALYAVLQQMTAASGA